MESTVAGLLGVGALLALLCVGIPVGFAMGVVGLCGFAFLVTWPAALSLLAKDVFETFSSYGLTVVPLFVLMGQVAFNAGISRRLYDSAFLLFGRLPGGLAMATVAGCAGFAAICGSTNATAATMASIAVPEMKRYNYSMKLATGTVAASGSLGVLIPPSIIFIIYGIITENSIGDLFAAGIIPGIILSALFVLTVYILVKIKPALAPLGSKTDVKQKLGSVTGVAEALLLFALVMGGLFWGIFTPTEAAAVGAFLTIAIAVLRRNLSWSGFVAALFQTTKISCMVLVIVTGATIFGRFLVVTRLPFDLASWVGDLPLSPVVIMGIIVLMHLVGGFFMDSLAMILLTVPIFFPVVLALGFDPIWFGVIIVLVTEMGVITPPVGINVYVVNAVVPEIPLESIFKGALPFLVAILLCTTILLAFPDVALFLPRLLK